METFGGTKWKVRATKHALECAHQIVMADEAKIAVFAES